MTLRNDIDASIDTMKAMCDAKLPDLPAVRIGSGDLRTVIDTQFTEMRTISDMTVDAMNTELAGKANVAHTHSIADVTGLQTALNSIPNSTVLSAKSDKSQFSALSAVSAHGQTNGQTNGATNSPTNSPTDAPTNYGLLAAILGSDINTTNSKQNTTAANVNTIATNVNALATKYNELATKFNALITWLGTTTTTGLTGNVNALRVAGAT